MAQGVNALASVLRKEDERHLRGSVDSAPVGIDYLNVTVAPTTITSLEVALLRLVGPSLLRLLPNSE